MTLSSKNLSRYLHNTPPIQGGWDEYDSNDASEVRQKVASIFCEHRLISDKKRDNLSYSHRILSGKSISLVHMRYGSEVSVETDSLHDHFIIPMPIQGAIEYKCGKRSGVATHLSAFIPKLDADYSFTMSNDCEAIIVRIDRASLEQKLTQLLQNSVSRAIDFEISMPLSVGAGLIWTATLRNYLENVYLARNMDSAMWLLREHEELLMTTLLYVQPNNYASVLEARFRNVVPRHIKIVEEYIRENAEDDITINNLVSITDIGARGLCAAFRKYHGCTPLQYLRSVRLEHVHDELSAGGPDITVTDVATRWGFYHLGRFSAAYKNRFGESPIDTLKRARSLFILN